MAKKYIPKNITVTKDELEMLDDLADIHSMNHSSLIRLAIQRLYQASHPDTESSAPPLQSAAVGNA